MSENLPVERNESPRREESAVVSASFSMVYSGSVPHPAIVEGYERFVPGAAERFLRMAEQEQQARIEAGKTEEENATQNFRLGLAASMGVMVLLFGFMFYCASLRLEAALIAALGVPLVGAIGSIIAQFVWRKK